VRHIRQLLQLNWQVHLSHTWREGNRSVDWLANFNYTLSSFSVHFLESPPRKLRIFFLTISSGLTRLGMSVKLCSFFSFGSPLLYKKKKRQVKTNEGTLNKKYYFIYIYIYINVCSNMDAF
jgi:hypothetical protein